mgnify:CR=1 FL=1
MRDQHDATTEIYVEEMQRRLKRTQNSFTRVSLGMADEYVLSRAAYRFSCPFSSFCFRACLLVTSASL